MILMALASRLVAHQAPDTGPDSRTSQSRLNRRLRDILALSKPTKRHSDFLARCGLLAACAFVCYYLGAGMALLLREAPEFACVLLVALLFFSQAAERTDRDS